MQAGPFAVPACSQRAIRFSWCGLCISGFRWELATEERGGHSTPARPREAAVALLTLRGRPSGWPAVGVDEWCLHGCGTVSKSAATKLSTSAVVWNR